MKLAHLRDFIAVAEAGSLRAAARKLNLSQPSLTKSIRLLEHELQAPLFHRLPRGMTLTREGQAFLARAHTAEHELERGREEVRQLRGSATGMVSFGVSASPSFLLLPRVLKNFKQQNPDIEVRMIGGVFHTVFPELRNGSVDFAIGPRPADELGSEFSIEELFSFEHVVVARRGHPKGQARSLRELLDEDWLVPAANGMRVKAMALEFARHGLEPPRSCTICEYVPAYLALLAESDMLMILPQFWVETSLLSSSLTRIPVREPLMTADLCIIRRRGLDPTPAADRMLDLIRREAEFHLRERQVSPALMRHPDAVALTDPGLESVR